MTRHMTALYATLFFLLRKTVLLEAQKPISWSLNPITSIPCLWLLNLAARFFFPPLFLGVYSTYSRIKIVDQSMKSAEQIFPIIHCIPIPD